MVTNSSFGAPKRLRVTLILAPQNANSVFPGTNSNTLIVADLRVITNVETVPGVPTHSDLKIFGLRKDIMDALTVAFFNLPSIATNTVILEANSGDGWSQVFEGVITDAQPEYRAAPAVYFGIQAQVGYQHQILPVPPTTYRGTVAVADVISVLAKAMGLAFENDGVTATLSNPYFPGTNLDQVKQACEHTGTSYVIAGGTLAIYPARSVRVNVPVLTVGPKSGLIGYPTLTKFGIVAATYYNPALQAGGRLKVVGSDVPGANGLWTPFQVNHQLEGNAPGGAWMSVSQCMPVKQ